jgi:hypothetical protein
MTISEAQDELKKINYQWFDFDYWALLQLYTRGVDEREFGKRYDLAIHLHNKRAAELDALKEKMSYEMVEAGQAGAACEETNRKYREELRRLVAAWRSLD